MVKNYIPKYRIFSLDSDQFSNKVALVYNFYRKTIILGGKYGIHASWQNRIES